MPKKTIHFLLVVMIANMPFVSFAQYANTNLSPIWGTPISNDPIWGTSEQKPATTFVEGIWTVHQPAQRNSSNNQNNNSTNQQQQSQIFERRQQQTQTTQSTLGQADNQQRGSVRSLNAYMRMDTLGNLIRSDSTALNNLDSAVTAMDYSMDNILPPPDDPVDAPIDGGIGILLAIGLVSIYNQSKKTASKKIIA